MPVSESRRPASPPAIIGTTRSTDCIHTLVSCVPDCKRKRGKPDQNSSGPSRRVDYYQLPPTEMVPAMRGSGADDPTPVGFHVAHRVAGIHDQRCMLGDHVPVVGRVVGRDQHAVLGAEVIGCDTPPGLKSDGFSGQPRQCGAYRPTAVSRPVGSIQDVDRGVVIPVEGHAALARHPAIRSPLVALRVGVIRAPCKREPL